MKTLKIFLIAIAAVLTFGTARAQVFVSAHIGDGPYCRRGVVVYRHPYYYYPYYRHAYYGYPYYRHGYYHRWYHRHAFAERVYY